MSSINPCSLISRACGGLTSLASPLIKTSLTSAITLGVSMAVAPFFKSPECVTPPPRLETIPATGLFSWFKTPETKWVQPADICHDVEPPLTTVAPVVLLTLAIIYVATKVLSNYLAAPAKADARQEVETNRDKTEEEKKSGGSLSKTSSSNETDASRPASLQVVENFLKEPPAPQLPPSVGPGLYRHPSLPANSALSAAHPSEESVFPIVPDYSSAFPMLPTLPSEVEARLRDIGDSKESTILTAGSVPDFQPNRNFVTPSGEELRKKAQTHRDLLKLREQHNNQVSFYDPAVANAGGSYGPTSFPAISLIPSGPSFAPLPGSGPNSDGPQFLAPPWRIRDAQNA